jgi:putative membrane protein
LDILLTAAIGTAIGMLTGLLPGLHVNLVAAIALSIPGIGAEAAFGLLAVGLVHTFVTILPTTYLGAPDADSALAVLPAHQLLHEGSAPEAVRISLYASMASAIVAVLLWWPFKWLLDQSGVLNVLTWSAPAILLIVPALMAWREPRRWQAFGIASLAAAIGWVGWTWPVVGIIKGAATPLLPMLSGLFGVPTLLWAIRARTTILQQYEPPPRMEKGTQVAVARGVAAAAFTAVLPGLTAAVATALSLPAGQHPPRRILAILSAVNTAHLVFAMGLLWILGRTRSGLAISWRALREPLPWARIPPPDALTAAGLVLVCGALAVVATTLMERPYRYVLLRVTPGLPEACALAMIVTLVAVTTGWLGCLLLLTCTVVGLVPLAAGVRRIHLAASLSVPIAFKLLG